MKPDACRYKIRLLLQHPDLDPDAISSATGENPDVPWVSGQPRGAPTGRSLTGAVPEAGRREGYCSTGNKGLLFMMWRALPRAGEVCRRNGADHCKLDLEA